MTGDEVEADHIGRPGANRRVVGSAGALLPTKSSGLPKDSVAVPLGLELIDRSLLGQQAGRLPDVLIGDIDNGLRAVVGI